MSYGQATKTMLLCDLCEEVLTWHIALPKTGARRVARETEGWRVDKLNRDICPAHPKRKGAR